MILLPPPITMSWFADRAMESTSAVCSTTDPICSCVIVSQNETDDPEEAAMNSPSHASAMQLYLSP